MITVHASLAVSFMRVPDLRIIPLAYILVFQAFFPTLALIILILAGSIHVNFVIICMYFIIVSILNERQMKRIKVRDDESFDLETKHALKRNEASVFIVLTTFVLWYTVVISYETVLLVSIFLIFPNLLSLYIFDYYIVKDQSNSRREEEETPSKETTEHTL